MGLVVEVKSVVSPKAKHLERLLNGEMELFYQIVIFHYRKDYSNCEMPLPLATVVLRFVSTWLYLPGFSWSYLFICALISFQKRLDTVLTSVKVTP